MNGGKQSENASQPDVKSGLHEAQIIYMKRIEKETFQRAMKLKRMKRNNKLTGFGLAGSVLGIYLYSILTVKQENFLDEIDEKKLQDNADAMRL